MNMLKNTIRLGGNAERVKILEIVLKKKKN